jgi:hypothetical protein
MYFVAISIPLACHASLICDKFHNDGIELFGRLFHFGCQDNGGDGDFKAINYQKGVFGIQSMKKDHGRQNGDMGQFQDASGFFNEATSLAALEGNASGRVVGNEFDPFPRSFCLMNCFENC